MAIPARGAFPDRFLKITQSTCFGDSGGLLFHEGTVVGINTWTFSFRCSGPNFAYRVDSTAARTFLEANLQTDCAGWRATPAKPAHLAPQRSQHTSSCVPAAGQGSFARIA